MPRLVTPERWLTKNCSIAKLIIFLSISKAAMHFLSALLTNVACSWLQVYTSAQIF
jgi:hypothetical protein